MDFVYFCLEMKKIIGFPKRKKRKYRNMKAKSINLTLFFINKKYNNK